MHIYTSWVCAKSLSMHQKAQFRLEIIVNLQVHNLYYLPTFFCADIIFSDQLNWNQNSRIARFFTI